ncbi:MAG: hypothetical protein AAF098_09975 [Pseudomonadota bacterium]
MIRRLLSRVLALAILLTLAQGLYAAGKGRLMYRYINAEGNRVLAFQVPPEFVSNGYEVLNASGSVVEVVPRQLDESELSSMDSDARRAKLAADEAERLRQWDESLLLRYSSVDDIEAARERELRDLKIRVSILKGKLRSLKQQVENYQSLAADQQRLGYDVNPQHLKAIEDLRGEIDSTERAIGDRQTEIDVVDADYDRDIGRFTTLLDIVEMRRTMSKSGS